jgi:uncharacterized delta-60 repeat protein
MAQVRSVRLWACLALAASLAAAAPAGAAEPGDVDVSFGSAGVAWADVVRATRHDQVKGGAATGLALFEDGGLFASGTIVPGPGRGATYTAWEPGGAADRAFSGDGISFPGLHGFRPRSSPSRLPTGDMVLGGGWTAEHYPYATVAVIRRDGTFDPTFGTAGLATLIGGGDDYSWFEGAVAQPDGKIVAAGHVRRDYSIVVRYDRSGRLDPTFGDGGIAKIDIGQEYQAGGIVDVELQPDGKVVIVADKRIFNPRADISQEFPVKFWRFLARFTKDGQLDPTFGDGGVVEDQLPRAIVETAGELAIQPDGKIVVGGSAGRDEAPNAYGNENYAAITRYRADGSRDPEFGTNGLARVRTMPVASAVELQDDGRILLAGEKQTSLDNPIRFFRFTNVVRLRRDGSIDKAFGDGGTVEFGGIESRSGGFGPGGQYGSFFASGIDVRVQDGGRILVTGELRECGRGVYAVVALRSEGTSAGPAAGPEARLCSPEAEESDGGLLPIELGCPALETLCSGVVTVEVPGLAALRTSAAGSRVTIGKGRFRAKGGRAQRARVRLSAGARRTLDRRGKLKAKVVVRVRNSRGRLGVARANVVLRAAR